MVLRAVAAGGPLSCRRCGGAELRVEELIACKRDGGRHSAAELARLVSGYVAGSVPDYQMAAWLMAAYVCGLDHDETVWLTDAMAHSGRVLDLSSVPGLKEWK